MPRPAHQLVTMTGVLGPTTAPLETWSWGLRADDRVWGDVSEMETAAQEIADAYSTLLRSTFTSLVTLTRVRVASISPDGTSVRRTADGGYLQGDADVSIAGTDSATVTHPPQTSLVVTLDTDRAGPTGRGRCFLPQPAAQVQRADLRIAEGTALAIANQFGDFINAVEAVLDPALTGRSVVVASSYGFLSPIRRVRVGRTLDTLRSRRRDILEAYVEVDVP